MPTPPEDPLSNLSGLPSAHTNAGMDARRGLVRRVVLPDGTVVYDKVLQTDAFLTAEQKRQNWERFRDIGAAPEFQARQEGNDVIIRTNTFLTVAHFLKTCSVVQAEVLKSQLRVLKDKLAHARLAHCDIKPANLVVDAENGRVLCIDIDHAVEFGQRRLVGTGAHVTWGPTDLSTDAVDFERLRVLTDTVRDRREERERRKAPMRVAQAARLGPMRSATTQVLVMTSKQHPIEVSRSAGAAAATGAAAVTTVVDSLARGEPVTAAAVAEGAVRGAAMDLGAMAGVKAAAKAFTSSRATAAAGGAGAALLSMAADVAIRRTVDERTAATGAVVGVTVAATDLAVAATTTVAGATAAVAGVQAIAGTVAAAYSMYATRHKPDHHMDKYTALSVVNEGAKGAACGALAYGMMLATPLGWGLLAGAGASILCYGLWTWAESKLSVQRKKHMEHCCHILGCGDDASKDWVKRQIRRKRAQFHPDRGEQNALALREVEEAAVIYCRLRGWDTDGIFD